MVHFRHGLVSELVRNQGRHRIEYHLLTIALAMVVIVKGAGAFSFDRVMDEHVVRSNTAQQGAEEGQ